MNSDEDLAYLISKGPPFNDREVRAGRGGVWKSEKIDGGEWTVPVPLEGDINSESNDWSVFVDEASSLFYVSGTREGGAIEGTYNIWVFDGGEEGEAQNLGLPINQGNVRSMWTDGRIMFFTGNNYPGGISTYDIFISIWED